METLLDTLAILGLFILRLGIPLALTLGAGWFLWRLDARWEAETRAEQRPVEQPRPARMPAPALLPQPLFTARDIFGQPCWEINQCQPQQTASCPARLHPAQPCWLARFRVEGTIPEKCYHCALFAPLGGNASITRPSEVEQPAVIH